MPLAASHSSPDAKDRKAKAVLYNGKYVKSKKYNLVEVIIDAVYCDILNGETRYHIFQKLKEGQYNGQTKGLKERSCASYYAAAKSRMREDMAMKADEAKNLILARFESVYNAALTIGDNSNANRALENLAKIFRLYDDVKTNVNIATDGGGGVTINFGFEDNETKLQNKSDEEAEGGIWTDTQ